MELVEGFCNWRLCDSFNVERNDRDPAILLVGAPVEPLVEAFVRQKKCENDRERLLSLLGTDPVLVMLSKWQRIHTELNLPSFRPLLNCFSLGE